MTQDKATTSIDKINDFLKRFGDKQGVSFRPLDDMGHTIVKKGSATVGINVLTKQRVLIFLAYILDVPEVKTHELYRKLLELNFLETADGCFAIDKKTNKVYLRALRGLDGLDYEEFTDILDTVASVADKWDDLLREEFGAKQ